MSYLGLLNSTAEIFNPGVITPDSYGTPEFNYVFFDRYPCRIMRLTGDEQFIDEKRTVISTHKIFLPQLTPINEKDVIGVNGLYYNVLYVYNVDILDHHLEVWVKYNENITVVYGSSSSSSSSGGTP